MKNKYTTTIRYVNAFGMPVKILLTALMEEFKQITYIAIDWAYEETGRLEDIMLNIRIDHDSIESVEDMLNFIRNKVSLTHTLYWYHTLQRIE